MLAMLGLYLRHLRFAPLPPALSNCLHLDAALQTQLGNAEKTMDSMLGGPEGRAPQTLKTSFPPPFRFLPFPFFAETKSWLRRKLSEDTFDILLIFFLLSVCFCRLAHRCPGLRMLTAWIRCWCTSWRFARMIISSLFRSWQRRRRQKIYRNPTEILHSPSPWLGVFPQHLLEPAPGDDCKTTPSFYAWIIRWNP